MLYRSDISVIGEMSLFCYNGFVIKRKEFTMIKILIFLFITGGWWS